MVRELISLGYLLARASDTVADTDFLAVDRRAILLAGLKEALLGREITPKLRSDLLAVSQELTHHGEAVLLSQMAALFEKYNQLSPEERDILRKVLVTICQTQQWDLTRFPGGRVTRLQSSAELEQYTYGVAGCVGEFWSEVIVLKGLVSAETGKRLLPLGKRYGRGLQLVNIIRDLDEDWEKGRCYIPGASLDKADATAQSVSWVRRAEEDLQGGLEYCRLLPRGRLRFATLLPALLAIKTLQKWQSSYHRGQRQRVKISRREVYFSLVEAAVRSF